jgi:hypothetical protein
VQQTLYIRGLKSLQQIIPVNPVLIHTNLVPTQPTLFFKLYFNFDIHVTVHHVKFLIIKPTRCTNFSNLFLEWKSTWFGQFLCPSSGVFHCTHSSGICHTGFLTACEQEHNGVPSWSCSQAVSKPVWHIPLLCVQWKTPDDGQRNCPNHVEFHSKNKFEKLERLVGFIIKNTIFIFFSHLPKFYKRSFSDSETKILHTLQKPCFPLMDVSCSAIWCF